MYRLDTPHNHVIVKYFNILCVCNIHYKYVIQVVFKTCIIRTMNNMVISWFFDVIGFVVGFLLIGGAFTLFSQNYKYVTSSGYEFFQPPTFIHGILITSGIGLIMSNIVYLCV